MNNPYRVRRPAKYVWRLFPTFDALTDVDEDVLKHLAAFAIEFNHMEFVIDECLGILLQLGTDLAPDIGFDVTSRINGMDGKIEILKAGIVGSQVLAPYANILAPTLTAVSEFKSYRDALIHARVEPQPSTTALTFIRRGSTFEVDLSVATLSILYHHIVCLGREVNGLFTVIEHDWSDSELIPDGDIDPKTVQHSPEFQAALAQVLEHRSHRQSLPTIPEFQA